MTAAIVQGILDRFLQKYLHNVTTEHATVWGGQLVFKNVELKLDVLQEEIGLPVVFRRGFVQELKVFLPLANLLREHIRISFSNVEVVAQTPTSTSGPESSNSKPAGNSNSTDSTRKQKTDNEQEGWVQSILTRIAINIKVDVNNLVFKYCTERFVCTFSFKTLSLQPTNSMWQPAFCDFAGPTKAACKVLSIEDVTWCLDAVDDGGRVPIFQPPIINRERISVRIIARKAPDGPVSHPQYPFRLPAAQLDIVGKSLTATINGAQLEMLYLLIEEVDDMITKIKKKVTPSKPESNEVQKENSMRSFASREGEEETSLASEMEMGGWVRRQFLNGEQSDDSDFGEELFEYEGLKSRGRSRWAIVDACFRIHLQDIVIKVTRQTHDFARDNNSVLLVQANLHDLSIYQRALRIVTQDDDCKPLPICSPGLAAKRSRSAWSTPPLSPSPAELELATARSIYDSDSMPQGSGCSSTGWTDTVNVRTFVFDDTIVCLGDAVLSFKGPPLSHEFLSCRRGGVDTFCNQFLSAMELFSREEYGENCAVVNHMKVTDVFDMENAETASKIQRVFKNDMVDALWPLQECEEEEAWISSSELCFVMGYSAMKQRVSRAHERVSFLSHCEVQAAHVAASPGGVSRLMDEEKKAYPQDGLGLHVKLRPVELLLHDRLLSVINKLVPSSKNSRKMSSSPAKSRPVALEQMSKDFTKSISKIPHLLVIKVEVQRVRISYASFDPLMMATPDGAERCLILSADSMELQSSFHEDGDDEQLAPSSAFVTPHATPKKDGSSSEPSSSYRARRPESSLHTACMSSRLRVNPRVRGGMMSGKILGLRCGIGVTCVEEGRLKINHVSKDYIFSYRSFTDSPSMVTLKMEMRRFNDEMALGARPRTPSPLGVQREPNDASILQETSANGDGMKFSAEVEEVCLFLSDHDMGSVLSVLCPSPSLERHGEQGGRGGTISDQQEDRTETPAQGGGGAGLSILLRGTLLDIQTGYKGLACRVETSSLHVQGPWVDLHLASSDADRAQGLSPAPLSLDVQIPWGRIHLQTGMQLLNELRRFPRHMRISPGLSKLVEHGLEGRVRVGGVTLSLSMLDMIPLISKLVGDGNLKSGHYGNKVPDVVTWERLVDAMTQVRQLQRENEMLKEQMSSLQTLEGDHGACLRSSIRPPVGRGLPLEMIGHASQSFSSSKHKKGSGAVDGSQVQEWLGMMGCQDGGEGGKAAGNVCNSSHWTRLILSRDYGSPRNLPVRPTIAGLVTYALLLHFVIAYLLHDLSKRGLPPSKLE